MNYTGIFDDFNYMTYEDELKTWMQNVRYNEYNTYNPKRFEFMDYVVKGMKNFLKSPFKSQ